MKKILLLITITFLISFLRGEEPVKPGKIFVIPIAGYRNETNIIVGGLLYYTYRPLSRPLTLQPDTHYINPIISFNKQWQINYRSRFYLLEDLYFVAPEIDYEVWPGKFYGIGNNTLSENEENFTNNRYSFRLGINRMVTESLTAGIILERDSYKLSSFEEGKVLASGNIPGSKNYNLNSIGLNFGYDSRDIALYPSGGYYHQFEVKQSLKGLGGAYNFTDYSLDLRWYTSLDKRQVLAFQSYISHLDNKVPFQRLNDLGNHVRGYEAKRYIDNSIFLLRGEYRIFPWTETILSRLGGVLFLESGQVASHFSNFQINETKISYGVGLRIALIPSERINLRVDFGVSRETLDIEVTTYEVF